MGTVKIFDKKLNFQTIKSSKLNEIHKQSEYKK